MSRSQLSQRVIDLSLQIPMVYHGLWNLFWGEDWWNSTFGILAFGRYFVGIAELVISLSLAFNYKRIFSLFLLIVLMIGATLTHWQDGYSFKNNGYETPLTYLLVALGLLLNEINRKRNYDK